MEKTLSEIKDIAELLPGATLVYQYDQRLKRIYYSKSVPELTGYTREEYEKMVASDPLALILPSDLESMGNSLIEGILAHRSVDISYRLMHKNGTVIWVRTHANYIGEMDGHPLYLASIFNINDEKENERLLLEVQSQKEEKHALEQQMTRLANVLENVAVGVYVFEFGKEGVSLRIANPAICEMIGTTQKQTIELKNEEILQRTHPDDMGIIRHVMKTLKEPGKSIEYEYRMFHVGKNDYIWLSAKGKSVAQADGTVLCYVTYYDITEQKILAEMQTKMEAERKANEAKSQFLANMSHEIRTPMNAILGMTRLAEEEVEAGSQAAEYIRQIGDSSEYLLGILNDILDMSSIDSGKMRLSEEWVTPNKILGSVIEVITSVMQSKHIHFDYKERILRQGKYEVWLDPQKTMQMIMNLLNNAVKFTPDYGTVWLRFRNRAWNRELRTATDEIIVKDNGYGMSAEFLKRIFMPFEQERSLETRNIPGTGLGLAISRSVARKMGGDITVESELGKGSTFTIRISYHYRECVDVQEKVDTQSDSRNLRLEGLHILLAEDHPLNAMIAIKLLEKKKIKVTHVMDGKQALQVFAENAENTFQIILMDVRMPNMDGLAATKAIRALDRADAKSIPIIAMTANAFDEDRRATREAGMNAHLSKPIEPDLLYDTIMEMTL